MYERAIADIPLTQQLWVDYIDYVATTLKEDEIILNICKRSVANCSWSSSLWSTYLIHAETYKHPHEELKGFYILLNTM